MVERLQELDFSDRRDGELDMISGSKDRMHYFTYTIAFALHSNLLERNHVFCVDMDTFEDLAVCARSHD
jgi:hypothetical protein